jgi:hypothetical protein
MEKAGMRRWAAMILTSVAACSGLSDGASVTDKHVSSPEPEFARITVQLPFEEDALRRLRAGGFEPKLERSADGTSTFILPEKDGFRAAVLIPPEYYATRGIVSSTDAHRMSALHPEQTVTTRPIADVRGDSLNPRYVGRR